MFNFDFYNPTRVLFGQGRIKDIDRRIPADARVMVLYGGGSIKTNGTLSEVLTALGTRHVIEFGGIEPNPSYETLIQAVSLAKQHNINFLLAVGGGSVIDGSKFVAAASCYQGEATEILQSRGSKIKQALPLGVVLTLSATGSEMNSAAVITQKAIKTKSAFFSERVFPAFAVLDPTKTYTLSKHQIANGVVDAFVHITEQYLTYSVNGLVQDRFAEGLLQTLLEIGETALAEPENYDLRSNLMWVATMALNGLIGAGVPQDWSTHGIGHELTALYDIDHARTLAIVLPAMLMERKEQKHAKLLQYAQRVWNIHEGDDTERVIQAVEKTRLFFERLGVPTRLSAYGVTDIQPILSQLANHQLTALGEHRDINLAVSERVLLNCL
ncbi:iron-containing alcohol dehydrogenase [Agitococcus lubricus]|uniref:NADP-dependent alcohol dehydrogenase n=1 Tax=Agitococcus lubricus TaxID=1077255 RepID=A0A2T5IYU8_9GAMM|nr:iron-containing alcohol dehydrogenase [Agitococcus lubricus]PTQ89126.1 NADP-dependent alcohol dehydrogenase [Agitococcus lubricus]